MLTWGGYLCKRSGAKKSMFEKLQNLFSALSLFDEADLKKYKNARDARATLQLIKEEAKGLRKVINENYKASKAK